MVAASLPKLLTPEQTAEALGVKVATLTAWRHHGRYPLRYTRVGRSIRYSADAVVEFIEQRTVATANAAE